MVWQNHNSFAFWNDSSRFISPCPILFWCVGLRSTRCFCFIHNFPSLPTPLTCIYVLKELDILISRHLCPLLQLQCCCCCFVFFLSLVLLYIQYLELWRKLQVKKIDFYIIQNKNSCSCKLLLSIWNCVFQCQRSFLKKKNWPCLTLVFFFLVGVWKP